RLRLVSAPPTLAGSRAARGAGATHSGALQLLRGEWQPAEYAVPALPRSTGVVQVAPTTEPTRATHLGKIPRPVTVLPFPDGSGGRDHLGVRAASSITGRAGWWKSPCPDLARAWVGKPAQATRQSPCGLWAGAERLCADGAKLPAATYAVA